MLALAAQGYAVTVPDFEGPDLHWVAGHESGWNTLDGIRATESHLGMPSSQKVGLFGYSGGSIAGEWASELAPSYAPELNIVGTAIGGIPVHLAHNTRYVNGSDTLVRRDAGGAGLAGPRVRHQDRQVRVDVRQAGHGRGAGRVHRRPSTATTRACGSSSCSRRSTTPSSRSAPFARTINRADHGQHAGPPADADVHGRRERRRHRRPRDDRQGRAGPGAPVLRRGRPRPARGRTTAPSTPRPGCSSSPRR